MRWTRKVYILSLVLLSLVAQGQNCPQQGSLNLLSFDHNSATFEVEEGFLSKAGYVIEFGPQNYTPGTGTSTNTTRDTVEIQGLQANTVYDFYIRDSCSNGVLSNWSNRSEALIRTPGNIVLDSLLPEAFAGTSIPSNWGNSGVPSFFNYYWTKNGQSVITGGTGFMPDHTDEADTTGYIFARPSQLGKFYGLVSPYFSVAHLQEPYMQCWVARNNTNISPALPFKVYAETEHERVELLEYRDNSPFWHNLEASLDTLSSDTVRLWFLYQMLPNSTNQGAKLLLDDIQVMEKPSCTEPKLDTITNISGNSAELRMESTGSEGIMVKFGLSSSTARTTLSSGTDTVILSGLPASESFVFYLKDSCAMGSTSQWSGPYYFSTECGITHAPVHYPFKVKPGMMDCFQRSSSPTLASQWEPRGAPPSTFNYSSDHFQDFSNSVDSTTLMEAKFLGPETKILQFPAVDISNLNNPSLSFWMYSLHDVAHQDNDTSANNTLRVQISDSSANPNWQTIYTYRGNDMNWLYHDVPLPSSAPDTLLYRLRARNTGAPSNLGYRANDLLVDELRVRERPSCLRPDTVYAGQISDSAFTIHWDGGSGNYEVEYERKEFQQGNGTIVTTTADSLRITGLFPNSFYKVYVRSLCSSDNSPYTIGTTVRTDCSVQTSFPVLQNFRIEPFNHHVFLSCWETTQMGSLHWGVQKANGHVSGGFGTGPRYDHNDTTLGKYAYLISNNGTPGDSATLSSPWYDGENLDQAQVDFYYHMYGNHMGTLRVKLDTGETTELISLSGQQQSSHGASWGLANLDLSNYNLDQFRLLFTGIQGNGPRSEISLANIRIYDTCFTRSVDSTFSYHIDTVTSDSARVIFTADDTNSSYYFWDFGDGHTDSTTTPTTQHSFSSNDIYGVTLEVPDICTERIFSTRQMVIIATIDLAEPPLPGVNVYPNPFHTKVHIALKDRHLSNSNNGYRLYSSVGQLVGEGPLRKSHTTLQIGHLPPGVYFLRLDLGDKSHQIKLLKE